MQEELTNCRELSHKNFNCSEFKWTLENFNAIMKLGTTLTSKVVKVDFADIQWAITLKRVNDHYWVNQNSKQMTTEQWEVVFWMNSKHKFSDLQYYVVLMFSDAGFCALRSEKYKNVQYNDNVVQLHNLKSILHMQHTKKLRNLVISGKVYFRSLWKTSSTPGIRYAKLQNFSSAIIKNMFYNPTETFSDYTFLLGEHQVKFHVHRCVLISASEFFKDLFTMPGLDHSNNECPLPNINPVAFKEVLRYIYLGKLGENCEEVKVCIGVYIAADFMMIESLKRYFYDKIDKFFDKTLSDEELIALYEFAWNRDEEEMLKRGWKLIQMNILNKILPKITTPPSITRVHHMITHKDLTEEFWQNQTDELYDEIGEEALQLA